MSTESTATLLLCSHLSTDGQGIDLDAIAARISADDADTRVLTLDHLCGRASQDWEQEPGPNKRLVLGLCARGYREVDFERRVRDAEIDPLGVQTIHLAGIAEASPMEGSAELRPVALLQAAVARARAFAGSSPAQLVPRFARFGERMSRRSLFTVPPLRYQPVVALERSQCAAADGCQLCQSVCPIGAISRSDRAVVIDRDRCTACGICVTSCPKQALTTPRDTPQQLSVAIRSLLRDDGPLSHASSPRHVAFVCRGTEVLRTPALLKAGWLTVTASCTGALDANILLRTLAAGANSVAVAACGDGCKVVQTARTALTVDYCRKLLELVGGPPEAIQLVGVDVPAPTSAVWPAMAGEAHDWPADRAEAVLSLAARCETPADARFEHPASPFGVVHVDSDLCTACGACAQACVSNALTLESGGTTQLFFDPAQCSGCMVCVGTCPEAAAGAIRVESATDIAVLRAGRVTAFESTVVRCEVCDRPVGPAAMLDRVTQLLAEDANEAVLAHIARRCSECRGIRPAGYRGTAPPIGQLKA